MTVVKCNRMRMICRELQWLVAERVTVVGCCDSNLVVANISEVKLNLSVLYLGAVMLA